MTRRRRQESVQPFVVETAPPCVVCGRESDDLGEDGRRYCGEDDPRTTPKDRAMLYAMRLGAWNPYIRPIF